MKFTIPKDALQTELTFVQSVVERRNTIPVLANVLIESISDNAVRISGTDLDVTIRGDVAGVQVAATGAMCVQAKKLFDIARLLPDGDVTFTSAENDWVIVEAGKSRFKLPGIAKEVFPELPAFKATPQSVNAALLTSLIQQTIFSITTEEGRYTLAGAKFEISKQRTRVVTTDGHRLTLVETNGSFHLQKNETIEALIPRKTLAEITKVAAGFDGDAQFGLDDNHVYFQIGTRMIISRLLFGQFPNYEMVMPTNNDNVATFDRLALSQALKRIALMSDRSRAVTLQITKDQTVIAAQCPEEGEGEEIVPSTLSGEELTIGFNAEYIQDVLNVTTSPEISFHFKNNSSQAEFRPVAEDNSQTLRAVIMPLRTT
jgi:DNA polymerase-3 subunit beta